MILPTVGGPIRNHFVDRVNTLKLWSSYSNFLDIVVNAGAGSFKTHSAVNNSMITTNSTTNGHDRQRSLCHKNILSFLHQGLDRNGGMVQILGNHFM